jgi:hypothetical protein
MPHLLGHCVLSIAHLYQVYGEYTVTAKKQTMQQLNSNIIIIVNNLMVVIRGTNIMLQSMWFRTLSDQNHSLSGSQ